MPQESRGLGPKRETSQATTTPGAPKAVASSSCRCHHQPEAVPAELAAESAERREEVGGEVEGREGVRPESGWVLHLSFPSAPSSGDPGGRSRLHRVPWSAERGARAATRLVRAAPPVSRLPRSPPGHAPPPPAEAHHSRGGPRSRHRTRAATREARRPRRFRQNQHAASTPVASFRGSAASTTAGDWARHAAPRAGNGCRGTCRHPRRAWSRAPCPCDGGEPRCIPLQTPLYAMCGARDTRPVAMERTVTSVEEWGSREACGETGLLGEMVFALQPEPETGERVAQRPTPPRPSETLTKNLSVGNERMRA